MTRRITYRDIAATAGVGVATVDRVLNRRAPVTPETASRVLAAAEALNYHGRGLMRRRVEQIAPARTLGFILQKKGNWIYRALAAALRDAAAELREVRAAVEIDFVERLSPDHLALALRRMCERVDTAALVAVDHPTVSAAIADCAAGGVPVFALLSRLDAPGLAGYVGIDGRKAGRTAGWAMSRLGAGRGEVGILIGSHRYLVQEDRESGFRAYLKASAPGIDLRESVVFMDDAAVAYEAAAEVLRASAGLTGLYHCGGGVEGAIRALSEAGRAGEVLYICHERSPAAVAGLLDGTVDLVIESPAEAIARTVTRAMAQTLAGAAPEAAGHTVPFRLVTAENV